MKLFWPRRRTLQSITQRGMALLTGLMVALFVLVLSLSLLELVQQEARFGSKQDAENRAYMIARSGLTLFRAEAEYFCSVPGQTFYYEVPDAQVPGDTRPPQFTQVVRLTLNPRWVARPGIESVGQIMTPAGPAPNGVPAPPLPSCTLVAERALFVPQDPKSPGVWDFSTLEDESQ